MPRAGTGASQNGGSWPLADRPLVSPFDPFLPFANATAVGTLASPLRLAPMGDDAKRFRDRARDCLNVAKSARHQADRIILEEMAAELEAEAKKIDAEELLRNAVNQSAKS